MEKSRDVILEKAFESALNYERKCTGCGQTTIAGGLTGDGACGALVGGAMVIGYLFGRKKKDFSDMMKPMTSYILTKRLHDRFVEKYGTCRCYDIQKSLMGRTFNLYDPSELKQATEYGMIDHCSKVVGTSARLATEIIIDEMDLQKDKK